MRIGIVLICLTLSACQTTHTRSLPNAQRSAAPFAASVQQNLDTYLAQAHDRRYCGQYWLITKPRR
jgi:hypothetical protein